MARLVETLAATLHYADAIWVSGTKRAHGQRLASGTCRKYTHMSQEALLAAAVLEASPVSGRAGLALLIPSPPLPGGRDHWDDLHAGGAEELQTVVSIDHNLGGAIAA